MKEGNWHKWVKQQVACFKTIRFIKAVFVCTCEKFQYCPIVLCWNLNIITVRLFQNTLSPLVIAYLLELIWWKNFFHTTCSRSQWTSGGWLFVQILAWIDNFDVILRVTRLAKRASDNLQQKYCIFFHDLRWDKFWFLLWAQMMSKGFVNFFLMFNIDYRMSPVIKRVASRIQYLNHRKWQCNTVDQICILQHFVLSWHIIINKSKVWIIKINNSDM